MTTSESAATADNPKLSAEEIGKRFLGLIKDLESRDDLTLGRVQDVLGVTLQYDASSSGAYYGQSLEGGWAFGVSFYDDRPGYKRNVGLGFNKRNGGSRTDPMPPSLCVLDFDHYHSALVAMGFRDVPIHGEIGQLESWRYYKNDFVVQIILRNIVPGTPGSLCVESIDMLP